MRGSLSHIRHRLWRDYLRFQTSLRPTLLRPRKAVLVFSSPRTGSSLLLDYLACTPNSHFFNELLHPQATWGRRGRNPKHHLRHVEGLFHRYHQPVMGFKIQLYQLETSHCTATEFGQLGEESRSIVLYRQDLLAQFVSYQRAMQSGVWEEVDPTPQMPPPLRVNTQEFIQFCAQTRKQYAKIQDLNALPLTYETLTETDPKILKPMLETHLKEPMNALTSLRQKQSPLELHHQVENWDEVQNKVSPEIRWFHPTGKEATSELL